MATNPPKLQLYYYWRSTCSQRVRIALGLKGLDFEYKPVNEQCDPEFEKINPIKYVPALVDGDIVIADSFAIILYLEDKYPQVPLLPRDDLRKKALNLQVASIVGSSIQPLQNIGVLRFIEEKFNSAESIVWAQHHIGKGFGESEWDGSQTRSDPSRHGLKTQHKLMVSKNIPMVQADEGQNSLRMLINKSAIEKLLEGCAGRYATGDEVQLADLFLAPQISGAIVRFKVDMSQFPTLLRLHEAYTEHPVFQASVPTRQPDAPSSA